jgi:hypothetical protein
LFYENADYKDTGIKKTETNFAEGLVGEYGLSPMFSLGVALSVSNAKLHNHATSKDTKIAGFNDIDFYLNGRTPIASSGSFRFGAHFFVSPEPRKKIDSSGDWNAASGRETLTPFIGFEIGTGIVTYGARLKYDVYKTKANFNQEIAPVSTGKIKDGGELKTSVFAEANLHPVIWGASLNLLNRKKSVIDLDPGPSLQTQVEASPAVSMLELDLYAAYAPKSWVTILPTIGYLDWTAVPNDIASKNGFFAALGARFEF